MSTDAEELADRIRAQIGLRPDITEKRMFGGIAFMLEGNMLVGTLKHSGLLVRVGKETYGEALARPGAEVMNFTGREMKGFVVVNDEAIDTDEALREWIGFAEAYVRTLPPK